MDFMEIRKKIMNLKDDEEIEKFVNDRIEELEKESIEKTVGQNYTTTYDGFISSKVHYKPAEKFFGQDCADLVYDDYEPYINLIKKLKDGYNLYDLFRQMGEVIQNYLPSDQLAEFRRMELYATSKVSIREVKKHRCAMCSENAGLSHNMFKILGIDSQLVCGYRNGEIHAYNIIYANGKSKGPMVIFDPSHYVEFKRDEDFYHFGFFSFLSDEDYYQLINGNEVKVDLSKTEEGYRKTYYNFLKDYSFNNEAPVYIEGLYNKNKKL